MNRAIMLSILLLSAEMAYSHHSYVVTYNPREKATVTGKIVSVRDSVF